MPNKYVDFVSDDDFLECVEKVVESYPDDDEKEQTSWETLSQYKNTNDPFKTLFDLYGYQFDLDEWNEFEIQRRTDKSVSNKIGNFHQNLLGKVDGWENLKRGHPSKLDLKKEDNSIFIELKNKHNTQNSTSLEPCRNKLEKILETCPDAKEAYWAYIVSDNCKSFTRVWEYPGRTVDSRIMEIAGANVYTLVTDNPNAFKQLFDALPKAMNDILGEEYHLTNEDQKIMDKYRNLIFKG